MIYIEIPAANFKSVRLTPRVLGRAIRQKIGASSVADGPDCALSCSWRTVSSIEPKVTAAFVDENNFVQIVADLDRVCWNTHTW